MKPQINLEYSKMVEKRIKTFEEKDKVRPRNKELVLKFVENAIREGIGERRIVKYFGVFKNIDNLLGKDFDKAIRKDIELLVGKIATSKYEAWTKWAYRVMIKKFYKWLEGRNEEYPEKVKWIKSKQGPCKITVPEDLITREDLKKLIETCTSDRDRCIVALLYESGFRIGELLGLKIKDIDFNSDPVKILVNAEKTKTKRRVPIVESVGYIARWIQSHPDKKPQSRLFVNCGKYAGNSMSAHCVRKVLKRLKENLNNGKKLNPHLFRHSRATELANHLTEAQMNKFFGWANGSDMPSVYVHLSGRDIDNAILNLYGKGNREEKLQGKLTPRLCPRCKENNLETDTLCLNCGLPLDEKTRMEFMNKARHMQPIYEKIEELIEAKIKEILSLKT
ncbi:MAG: tyrosine-type recombinase/integrase [Candidatus Aenigmarchaeota archaeon]|nr:tyrosine-type recombinase/integrase [Candidatus Aenigmarchaeota archaeon]NIP40665.1 tyrosine-type recombinase/integrase [Candidatus Aenigmarchaeota archaeon]NIQ18471.1 tyrosine-type recombinase/integrase [Candidatus Aenigmarchaeota archaeon]NIS73370.1 tyrosine-type recombinase/integrase [Candidatus Aenigmarchaeota archaeon]